MDDVRKINVSRVVWHSEQRTSVDIYTDKGTVLAVPENLARAVMGKIDFDRLINMPENVPPNRIPSKTLLYSEFHIFKKYSMVRQQRLDRVENNVKGDVH